MYVKSNGTAKPVRQVYINNRSLKIRIHVHEVMATSRIPVHVYALDSTPVVGAKILYGPEIYENAADQVVA